MSFLLSASALLLIGGSPAIAQQERALPPITLDLRDAPIRQALEQLFAAAKVDFQIDNSVVGFVTLKITEQPFENALKLILRASPVPLTYARESGVFIVKPRPLALTDPSLAAAPPPPFEGTQKPNYQPLEQIQLTYIDPMDLANILGIQFIQTSVRQGGMGGGMGGMGGGMMGGMGGMGGGMMGGMGGMGGGMGGMGMGGFGGGRGF
jgi:type II secretory pathway component GspD/PulD (secretin)